MEDIRISMKTKTKMKNILHYTIVFSCLTVISCQSGHKAKGPEKLMHEHMLKNVDDPAKYEVVENILVDSTMVDSVTFKRIKNWDGRSPLSDLINDPYYINPNGYTTAREEETTIPAVDSVITLVSVDTIKKPELPKNIVAFYTYQHKYRIQKKHGKKLQSKLFLYDPRRHKIFDDEASSEFMKYFLSRSFDGD
ncbi:MAG: hypothetical protein K0S32_243 [Bacteroidetes bacterium]|jgi:hypothetical protein|nr:hypothetical protein [Bacteroidota bacterium]